MVSSRLSPLLILVLRVSKQCRPQKVALHYFQEDVSRLERENFEILLFVVKKNQKKMSSRRYDTTN